MEHETWEQLWSARASLATSSASSMADEQISQLADAVEDKVFVAVAEEVSDGRSAVLWAMHNLVGDGSKVVIAHVHSAARAIAKMRGHSSMRPEEIKEYRKLMRAKAEKSLDEYVLIAKCAREDLEVSCEKVIIEIDNVAQGLEELIVLHNITELVMGAAADQHFSKEMNTPKSKTALKLMETAAPSCKIWFTCKGHLICTREANESLPAIPPSPAKSISSQMDSMALTELEYEISSSKLYTSRSLVAAEMTDWDYLFGDWGMTVYGSSRIDDAANFSRTTALPPIIGDTNELVPVLHSPTQGSDNVYLLLASEHNQAYPLVILLKFAHHQMSLQIEESEYSYIKEVNQRKENEKTLDRQRLQIDEMRRQQCTLSDELQDSNKHNLMLEQRITQIKGVAKEHLEEITDYFIKQSCEEFKKRQKIKMDLLSTLQRVKELESLLQNEKTQREYMEEKAARQRTEIEETKRQRDKLYYDLQDVKEQRLRLEQMDASEETKRRRKAEKDLLTYLQRVAVLSRVRHPNLVTLIGACPDDFALVYEFLPNGSLENWLSCKKNMPPLTWKVRTRIIGEICSALAFIHSHKPYPIVHGDLNLANILLDVNFISKVANLGICHLLRQPDLPTTNLQRHPTKNHKGTPSYMDNGEFKSARELMLWSDVNSFGFIILRLLTGRSQQQIGEIVEQAVEKGNLHSIIDASAGDWPFAQANKMAHLGLRCITLSWGRQPDLAGEVWVVIEQLMKAAGLTTEPSRFASPSDAPAPSHFMCPIFQEVMTDPHMAADGFTYEAEAIRGWLHGANTSPMTNLTLANRKLIPNKALRSAILEWRQHQHQR
nr:unnamed protein product [Digitaria exilis]